MEFWIFMLIMDLLIPAIMIGIGAYFRKYAPKEINDVFGYRTAMSMKNKDTWEFAHHHCGNIWCKMGWVMLLLSAIAMLLLLGRNEEMVGIWGAIICSVQVLFLVVSIVKTEYALRKKFDQQGHKRFD